MTFIIVEGATCTGKSTLIKRLHDEHGSGVEPLHKGRPDELTRRWALTDYVLAHENYRPGTGHSIVSDRWHWGEATYATVYRPDTNSDGYGLLGKAGWRWVEMFLCSRGAVVAQLYASDDTLMKRFAERGDDHVKNVDELVRIKRLYEHARREAYTVGAIYDTSPHDASDVRFDAFVKHLLEEAERREQRASEIVNSWPEYTGALYPQALLVGDRRNVTEKYGNETRLPFMPVEGNSGDYLLRALPDMFWRSVGIINGAEVDDIEGLWDSLGQPRVIALGNQAEAELLQHDFASSEFATLPHPQYVRRFRHSKMKEYGRAIQAAAETGRHDWTT